MADITVDGDLGGVGTQIIDSLIDCVDSVIAPWEQICSVLDFQGSAATVPWASGLVEMRTVSEGTSPFLAGSEVDRPTQSETLTPERMDCPIAVDRLALRDSAGLQAQILRSDFADAVSNYLSTSAITAIAAGAELTGGETSAATSLAKVMATRGQLRSTGKCGSSDISAIWHPVAFASYLTLLGDAAKFEAAGRTANAGGTLVPWGGVMSMEDMNLTNNGTDYLSYMFAKKAVVLGWRQKPVITIRENPDGLSYFFNCQMSVGFVVTNGLWISTMPFVS